MRILLNLKRGNFMKNTEKYRNDFKNAFEWAVYTYKLTLVDKSNENLDEIFYYLNYLLTK
jgi:hypothetical protein